VQHLLVKLGESDGTERCVCLFVLRRCASDTTDHELLRDARSARKSEPSSVEYLYAVIDDST